MNRYAVTALLIAVVGLCSAETGSAQVIINQATSNPNPMVITSYTGVVAGRTYQFRTDPATVTGTEDTVLALMNPSASTNGAAIAGADGETCTGGGFAASCFEWVAPAGVPSTVQLRLWAYRPSTGGVATVQQRSRVGTAWGTVEANAVFGGNAISQTFSTVPSSSRLHVATRHRPGNNASHLMWISNTNEWQIIANTYRAPDDIGRAIFDVPDLVAAGVSGTRVVVAGAFPWAGNVGGMELLRNNWFIAGEDEDGDGLSQTLEASLKTCDRATSPNPSPGFSCANLWWCGDFPNSSQCRAVRRDTDHDGLTDYHEVYEYSDSTSNDLLLRFSLWGANPAAMDMFMDVDGNDHNTSMTGCQPFTELNIGGARATCSSNGLARRGWRALQR
jgi:hypothetical protein